MDSSIAFFVLMVWPVFVFMLLSKYGFKTGFVLVLFISYLFLPSGYDVNFKGIPTLNKGSITSLSVLFYLLLNNKLLSIFKIGPWRFFILILLIMSPFLTALTNSERYLHLPGMTVYDGLSQSAANFLIFIPFLLGFKYYGKYEDQLLIFRTFIVFMVFYSLLILFEIRMSPQLHRLFYGFHPHSFVQQFRDGGFRAVVFVGHGLLVSMLIAIALLVCSIFYKLKLKIMGFNAIYFVAFFLVLLFLNKSYGAFFLGILGLLIILFFSPKMILLFSGLIASFFLIYPVLIYFNLFPHQTIVDVASMVNYDRAHSLGFRFNHEVNLMVHASDKLLFGWGSWGRNRIYDSETFQDLSVTDGRWIITLGTRGFFGYVTEYFFIVLSVVSAAMTLKYRSFIKRNDLFLLSSNALVVAIILADQIPNSSLNYFYWFFSGALYSRVISLRKEAIYNMKDKNFIK